MSYFYLKWLLACLRRIHPRCILSLLGKRRKRLISSDIHSQNGLAFTKAEIDGILQSGTKVDAILNAGDMTFLSHTGEAEEKENENKIELFKTVISSRNKKIF